MNRTQNLRISFFFLCVLLAAACGQKPRMVEPGDSWEGYASWYGGQFHGRKTASGERYDMNAMTAAHRTAPFGTIVRVTNLDNQRKTTVRINDRGPFVKGRIIDLSLAAAKELEMTGTGTARVRLDFMEKEAGTEHYIIQVGAFRETANARKLRSELSARVSARVDVIISDDLHRVWIGPILDEAEAARMVEDLTGKGYEALILRR